jgi:hypothetical protein
LSWAEPLAYRGPRGGEHGSRRGFLKALAGRRSSRLAQGPRPVAAPATAGASASVEEALTEAIRLQFEPTSTAELEEVRKELSATALRRARAAARLANADDLVTRFEARPPVPPTPVGRGVTR